MPPRRRPPEPAQRTLVSLPFVQVPELTTRVEPEAQPELSLRAREEVEEWAEAWVRSDELLGAGATLPGALLLYGPTGTGKTRTTGWIAQLLGSRFPTCCLDAHSYVGQYLNESGRALNKVFEQLRVVPACLVLEEIDAVGETRGVRDEVGEIKRVTIALLRLLEGVSFPVVATTNRFGALDPALRRRFEYRVELQERLPVQRRLVVAEELGVDPSRVPLSLVPERVEDAVLVSRRARRRAALRRTDPVEELQRIVLVPPVVP